MIRLGCGLGGAHGGSEPRHHGAGRGQGEPAADRGGGQLVHGGHLPRPLPPARGPHDHPRLRQHLLRVALRPPPQPQGVRAQTRAGGPQPLRQEDHHTLQPSLCAKKRRR